MLHTLRSLQLQGKLESAERNFKRILTATPKHIHAHLGLAYCAWLVGDLVGAKHALAIAISVDPVDENPVIDCATALVQTGQFTEAEHFLSRKPQTPRVLTIRGNIAEQLGDIQNATTFYEAALTSDEKPNDAAFQHLISLHRRFGQFKEALTAVDALEASGDNKTSTAAYLRGQLYVSMGRHRDAVATYRKALIGDPTSELCLLALAQELNRVGQNQDADALLSASPKTMNILLERSALALTRRDAIAARHYAEAAAQLQPTRSEPLIRLTRIEIDQGCYEAAYLAANRLIIKGPEFRVQHIRTLIEIAQAQNDEQQAKALLVKLVALFPLDVPARVDLATTLRKIGDRIGATSEIARALEIDPRSVPALNEAGEQALRNQDYLEARQFYRRVLDVAPDNIYHHLRLARLLQTMDSDEQFEVLSACKARFGNAAEIQVDCIGRLREAGKLDDALEKAEEAVSNHPHMFPLWIDCFDLTLRLRSATEAQRLLTCIPVRNRREELVMILQHALLAIRVSHWDAARQLLEKGLIQDPHNKSFLNALFLLSIRRNDLADATRYNLEVARLAAPEHRMTGGTSNASQSHSGQMVNDMRLDRAAMMALEQVHGGTSRNRIRQLLDLVHKRPDHIPTAQALVVALSDSGRFASPDSSIVAPSINPHIPKRISQYWDNDQLPRDLLDVTESWRSVNPDYEYRLYNDNAARTYLAERLPEAVLHAYVRAVDATTKADLFRLAVLTLEGGTWADVDDRCLKPITMLFRPEDRAVFWQERTGHICNNFMAAVPNHPILVRALVTATNAINRGDRDKVWMLTGPGLVTRCFSQEMASSGATWPLWLTQVNVISEFDIWPVVAMHCTAVYKRQGRHWHKEAFRKGKRGAYPPASAHSSRHQV